MGQYLHWTKDPADCWPPLPVDVHRGEHGGGGHQDRGDHGHGHAAGRPATGPRPRPRPGPRRHPALDQPRRQRLARAVQRGNLRRKYFLRKNIWGSEKICDLRGDDAVSGPVVRGELEAVPGGRHQVRDDETLLLGPARELQSTVVSWPRR